MVGCGFGERDGGREEKRRPSRFNPLQRIPSKCCAVALSRQTCPALKLVAHLAGLPGHSFPRSLKPRPLGMKRVFRSGGRRARKALEVLNELQNVKRGNGGVRGVESRRAKLRLLCIASEAGRQEDRREAREGVCEEK